MGVFGNKYVQKTRSCWLTIFNSVFKSDENEMKWNDQMWKDIFIALIGFFFSFAQLPKPNSLGLVQLNFGYKQNTIN